MNGRIVAREGYALCKDDTLIKTPVNGNSAEKRLLFSFIQSIEETELLMKSKSQYWSKAQINLTVFVVLV